MTGAPMLKAAALWEKTSSAGSRYFVGRWGGVKILILENRDRGEGDPTHHLFITEAAEKPRSGAQEARDGAADKSASPRRYTHQRPPSRTGGADPRPFDDRLDDIGVAP